MSGIFVDDEEDRDAGGASPGEECVAVLAPVPVPVGIAFTKRELETAGSDRFDLAQHAADEFPACGKPVAKEIRMRVVECVEQHLKEVGRMRQVLHVDRHHLESVLGMVAQVVHDAGLAGSSGRR